MSTAGSDLRPKVPHWYAAPDGGRCQGCGLERDAPCHDPEAVRAYMLRKDEPGVRGGSDAKDPWAGLTAAQIEKRIADRRARRIAARRAARAGRPASVFPPGGPPRAG